MGSFSWFSVVGFCIAFFCTIISPSYLAICALIIRIFLWRSDSCEQGPSSQGTAVLFAFCFGMVTVCNLYLNILQYFILRRDLIGNLFILIFSQSWILLFVSSFYRLIPFSKRRTFSYGALAASLAFGLSLWLVTPLRLYFWLQSVDNHPVELKVSPLSQPSLVVKGGSPWFLGHQYSWGIDLIPIETLAGKEYLKSPLGLDLLAGWHVENCFAIEVNSPIPNARVKGSFDGYPDDPKQKSSTDDGCGNFIVLESRDKSGPLFIRFCHLKQGSILVKNGEEVSLGRTLARCGNSGNSSTPHLHLEAYRTDENSTVPLVSRQINGGLSSWWSNHLSGIVSPQKLDVIEVEKEGYRE